MAIAVSRDDGTGNGESGSSRSCRSRSGARDVARMASSRGCGEETRHGPGKFRWWPKLLQVVEQEKRALIREHAAPVARPAAPHRFRARRARRRSAAAASGARSGPPDRGTRLRRQNRRAVPPAAASARRVFPLPPAPVTVTSRVRLGKEAEDRRHLGLTPDQRRRRERQVLGRRCSGTQWRELSWQSGRDNLPDLLGFQQIAQLLLAQGAKRDAWQIWCRAGGCTPHWR